MTAKQAQRSRDAVRSRADALRDKEPDRHSAFDLDKPHTKAHGAWRRKMAQLRKKEEHYQKQYERALDRGERGNPRRRNSPKRPKKGKLSKRVPAAMSKWIRKQNPAMARATAVRVKKLKGGGVTITPVK